jgi:hypothetical protein
VLQDRLHQVIAKKPGAADNQQVFAFEVAEFVT